MPKPAGSQFRRVEAVSLAAALTILAATLPSSWLLQQLYEAFFSGHELLNLARFSDLVLIAIGLMLTLPDPRGSGLCVGRIREHWKGVLLVTAIPVLATAIVYPQLPRRPFAGSDLSIWLTSPLAQDLIFGGVIYRILRPHFAERVHPLLPFEWVLPVGGLFFSAWHLQNFAAFDADYVVFQLLYTWAGYTIAGLTRQWTGSLLYVTLAHMAGNFIAWYAN
ncbi:MAG TPA: CPBP family intramembrane glutamic endopeptidase [Gemmataceae bacterium]|nr:CPBP family intramembrane glutamic endopeptidase [Gemmataceae bacterium]